MTQITKEWSIFHTKWRPLSASVDGPTMVARATSHPYTYHVSFVSQLNRQDQIKLDSKNIFPRKGQWPAAQKLYAFYDKRWWSIIQCMSDVSHYKNSEILTEAMTLYSGIWRRVAWKKVTNYEGKSCLRLQGGIEEATGSPEDTQRRAFTYMVHHLSN